MARSPWPPLSRLGRYEYGRSLACGSIRTCGSLCMRAARTLLAHRARAARHSSTIPSAQPKDTKEQETWIL